MASRPGNFSVGAVLSGAFTSIRDNWLVYLSFAAVVYLIPIAINLWMFASVLSGLGAPGDPGRALGIFSSPLYWLSLVAGILASSVMQGGLVAAMARGSHAAPARFADCLGWGLRVAVPLTVLSILWGLAIGLGMALLVVPGLIFLTMWSVAMPALIVERKGIFAAFARSSDLTKGYRWPVFGVLLILMLFYAVLVSMLGGAQMMRGSYALYTETPILGGVLQLLSGTLIALLVSGFVSSLYRELVIAKEGGFTEHLAEVFA